MTGEKSEIGGMLGYIQDFESFNMNDLIYTSPKQEQEGEFVCLTKTAEIEVKIKDKIVKIISKRKYDVAAKREYFIFLLQNQQGADAIYCQPDN